MLQCASLTRKKFDRIDDCVICVVHEQLIQAGKGEALRIRAILRSLVPIEDLVGVISLPQQIPAFGKGEDDIYIIYLIVMIT